MARVLFTVWPFDTHIEPSLAVARALRDRGHSVAFYTGASACTGLRAEGFQCMPMGVLDERFAAQAVLALISGRRRLLRLGILWRRFVLDTIEAQLRDIGPIVSEWLPDAIVCDMAMWGPFLILHETRRIPVAVLSHIGTCILEGREGHATHRRALGRRDRPGSLVSRLVAVGSALATRHVRSRANKLRLAHGLQPISTTVTEFAGTMPLYLVPGVAEFDGLRQGLPPSVHYVGLCSTFPTSGVPKCRGAARAPACPRRVLVYEGTLYSAEPTLLEAAIRGLAGAPVDVVAVAGKDRDIFDLKLCPATSNITIHEWVPMGEFLGWADAVITNGSSQCTLQALARGLPVLAVPAALEQLSTAERLRQSGAGIALDERRCRPDAVRASVDRLLADGSTYRRQALLMAEAFARHRGPAEAAELLEDVLGWRMEGDLPGAAGQEWQQTVGTEG